MTATTCTGTGKSGWCLTHRHGAACGFGACTCDCHDTTNGDS